MKVIVAGLSKTGTKTMCAALTILGYDVYDWMENFYYLGDDWAKQFREGFRVEDMRRMYEKVDAVTDAPCDVYWEEIFEAFPNAKVVLTERDEKSWLKSFQSQMDELNNNIHFRLIRTITYAGIKAQFHMSRVARHVGIARTWPFSDFVLFHDETLIRFKRKHEQRVKEVVPKSQLLVYRVKDGWDPLCAFLGVGVPSVPFPHKNKGGSVLEQYRKENPVMQRMQNELRFSLSCLFAFFVFGVYHMFF